MSRLVRGAFVVASVLSLVAWSAPPAGAAMLWSSVNSYHQEGTFGPIDEDYNGCWQPAAPFEAFTSSHGGGIVADVFVDYGRLSADLGIIDTFYGPHPAEWTGLTSFAAHVEASFDDTVTINHPVYDGLPGTFTAWYTCDFAASHTASPDPVDEGSGSAYWMASLYVGPDTADWVDYGGDWFMPGGYTGDAAPGFTSTGEIDFVYGEPFTIWGSVTFYTGGVIDEEGIIDVDSWFDAPDALVWQGMTGLDDGATVTSERGLDWSLPYPMPEPATLVLMAAGAVGLVFVRRRR